MSDLIISYQGQTLPPQACTEPPPQPNARGVTPPDRCYFVLPLVDDANPGATPRPVRFDRSGDQFILSPQNSLELRAWFESHANAPRILDTLRLTGAMLRGPELRISEGNLRFFLVIAQYVATGEIRSDERGQTSADDQFEVAQGVLDIFADTREDILAPIIGQLVVARRSAWLSSEALERIRWITSILDLVEPYRQFRSHFVSQQDIDGWYELPEQRRNSLNRLLLFLRQVIVNYHADRPLRFQASFLEAYDAHRQLYREEITAGRMEEFCQALSQGLTQLPGSRGTGRAFMQECQEALRLRGLAPEEALRDSLRRELLSTEGRQRLQQAIEEESEEANMSVPWLMRRGEAEGGRIREVVDVLMRNMQVNFPESGEGGPTLSLNVPGLRLALEVLIENNDMTRREYILSVLAVMRVVFGEAGEPPAWRGFFQDRFREIAWNISEEDLAALRRFLHAMEDVRESSQEGSDVFLPILEAAVCAVGIGGLLTTELAPEIRGEHGLHLGLGTTAAGLTGLGCTSFIGHFIWPEVAEDAVHNHYLWDGITGLVGAGVGIGLYLLITLLGGGNGIGPDTEFGVDEYGR